MLGAYFYGDTAAHSRASCLLLAQVSADEDEKGSTKVKPALIILPLRTPTRDVWPILVVGAEACSWP
jgi:hypothetical protein